MPARPARGTAAKPGLAPFMLVNGGDEYLNARMVIGLRQKARKLLPDAEIVALDAQQADQYSFSEVVSPSLLSQASIVILDRFEYCSDSLLSAITDFLKTAPERLTEPGQSDTSIVIATRAQGQRGSGLVQRLKKTQAEIVAPPDLRRDRDRMDFARSRFARRHRSIRPDALTELVGVMGSRTGELAAMCDQICDDTQEDPVTLATVASFMDNTAEITGFQVADAALAGNAAQAVLRLRQALARGAEPVVLVGALASKLRSLAQVAAIQAGTLDESRASIPGWLVRKQRLQLRGWTSVGMSRAFEALAHADETAKGMGGNPEYELEKAVELICQKGAIADGR